MDTLSFEFFKAGLDKIQKIQSTDQYVFSVFNFSCCILSLS